MRRANASAWAVPALAAVLFLSSACGKTTADTKKGTDAAETAETVTTAEAETETKEETGAESAAETSTPETAAKKEESSAAEKEKNGPVPLQVRISRQWDGSYSEDGNITYVSGEYPQISIGHYVNAEWKEDTEYGKLARSLKQYNADTENNFLANLKDYAETAKQDPAFTEPDKEPGYRYSLETRASAARADELLFSIYEETYSYSGGAHPYTDYSGYTYDTKSGKRLDILDVVKDKDELIRTLTDELTRQYPDIGDALVTGDESLENSVRAYFEDKELGGLDFTMGNSGMTVMFSAYELTAYAYGPEFVFLSYREHPELFKEQYLSGPADYMQVLGLYDQYHIEDAAGQDQKLQILFTPQDENTDSHDLEIICGSMDYKESCDSAYDALPVLVHADGRNYIYMDFLSDNDYEYTVVYDLNGAAVQKSETIQAAFYDNIPNDVSDFILETRTDVLSTRSVLRHYSLRAADGIPEPKTDYWWYADAGYGEDAPVITSRTDLTLDVLANPGDETGIKKTVPAGTRFHFLCTDQKTYADMYIDKNTIVRVPVSTDSWPQTINGHNIEDTFDGIMFAG